MMLKESCNNFWMTRFFFFLIFEFDLCHFYISFPTSRLRAGQNTLDKIISSIAHANLLTWERC